MIMVMSWSRKVLVTGIVIVVIVLSLWIASTQLQAGTNVKDPQATGTPRPTPTEYPTNVASPTSFPQKTSTPNPSMTPSQTTTPPPTQSTPTPTPVPTPTQPPIAPSGTIAMFNFDNDLSNLYLRQPTPVSQTSSSITAQFTSASYPPSAFSIQSQGTTSFVLSRTSGNYLEHSTSGRNNLDINFSQPIKSITLTFATIDYHDPAAGNPTPIQLTAYSDTAKTTTVGNPVTVSGSFITGDSYPQGTITFSSSMPFSMVEIQMVWLGQGAVDYIVDNISVTAA